ncbi:hypothetical protein [Kiloniella antarctica]|uniref:TraG N-terminal Proteobacteria domain-containing protein n=1 Tax=Kiloniella antarctica TaxID=1550907 RepID=A0ABW5BHB5_9PROT
MALFVIWIFMLASQIIEEIYDAFFSTSSGYSRGNYTIWEGVLDVFIKYTLYFLLFLLPKSLPVLVACLILNFFGNERFPVLLLVFLIGFVWSDIQSLFQYMSPREGSSSFGYSTRDCDVIINNVRTDCGYEIWTKEFLINLFKGGITAVLYSKFYSRKRTDNVGQVAT